MMLRRKVMQQMLVERAERIDLLEQQLDTLQQERLRMEESIAAYSKREQTIVETLTNAQQAAKKSIADADARAAEIVAAAKAQADKLLEEAKEKSARLLSQAEITVAEYEQTLAEYNETVERAAEAAAQNAASYAAFVRSRRIDVPALVRDAERLGTAPFEPEIVLQPADDDPAQLMQNIYRIQNRSIPDVEMPGSAPAPVYTPPAEPKPAAVTPAPEPAAVTSAPEPAEARPAPEPTAVTPAPEPEAEPAQEVPTVEQFYKSMQADDDGMSLDALLDEIIKAGE